ncbi:hypothetical protein L1887_10623 [Cichorium endivia]|nr:hypothetical protein L1887_10623 [Cichorium endivia]
MGKSKMISVDGYETHMQVNFLSPALLSLLILPSLKVGAPSRIVNVNSLMHGIGFVDLRDLNFDKGVFCMRVCIMRYGSIVRTEKMKEEEWPVCAYVACDCKMMIPSKEAQNMEVSRSVWKMTLEMIGVPNDVVDLVLADEEIHCRYLNTMVKGKYT